MILKGKNKQRLIKFDGKSYAIDIERFKSVCMPTSTELATREYEISQVYEHLDDGELGLASKVEHETKGNTNPQNDMIVYDVIKMLLVSLLENDKTEDEFDFDFGTALALNTLINIGVIIEIND